MREALVPEKRNSEAAGDRISRWACLLRWCCQAAGGCPDSADDLTVAWLLFYAAAGLMDSVQDDDEPDAWWADLGQGAALSAATGLFFSASLALNRLHAREETSRVAAVIVEDFYNSLLVMASGQQKDVTNQQPSLEEYWQQAEAKSGAFFALGCRASAQIATTDPSRLEHFSQFGNHLGLLIQIKDDLEEFQSQNQIRNAKWLADISRSLAVVYTLDVCQLSDKERIRQCLFATTDDPVAVEEVIDIIDRSGAGVYILAELDRHRRLAKTALEQAKPQSPAAENLFNILENY